MRLIGLFMMLTIFTGCESIGEPQVADGSIPVRFRTAFQGSIKATTRVIDQTWFTSDIIGVSMIAGDGQSSDWICYCPDSEGTDPALIPLDAMQTLNYPNDGSTVTFTAFCPFVEPVDGMITFEAADFSDQSTPEKMQAVDLIYHKGATGNKHSPPVSLGFDHKFSRIVLSVVSDRDVDKDLISLSTTISGVPISFNYSLVDATINTVFSVGDIGLCHTTSTSDMVSAMAIIPPHRGAELGKREILLQGEGMDYSYTLSDEFDFEPGMSYKFNFMLTSSGIKLAASTIAPWNPGSMAWDGDGNTLAAPSELNHHRNGGGAFEMWIRSSINQTPDVQLSTQADANTTTPDWLEVIDLKQISDTSPYEWVLTYNVQPTEEERTAYVHSTIGGMTLVTKVMQTAGMFENVRYVNGEANCFMMKPGETIAFPLSRPIYEKRAGVDDEFVAMKRWDDTEGEAVRNFSIVGKGRNAYYIVTAGPNPGNALIYARVNITNITTVWSYHIWVTDYDPSKQNFTNTYNTNNDGGHFVFMDRNLGATVAGRGSGYGYGLFYQWGRKDPFPATGSPSETQPGGGTFTASGVNVNAEYGTVDYAIKYPHLFLQAGEATSYDWIHGGGPLASQRDYTLWGHNAGKSIYDPCPEGWRVPMNYNPIAELSKPESSPWAGFVETGTNRPVNHDPETFDQGFQWGEHAAYPATGHRDYATGILTHVGLAGYYASASPTSDNDVNGLNATGMSFTNSNYISIFPGLPRARACSVRCVRE